MKVYVITEGSYSDYHIVGVTLDRDKAERAAKLVEGVCSYPEIEEWETDEVDLIKDGSAYDVILFSNRTVEVRKCSWVNLGGINKVTKAWYGNAYRVTVIAENDLIARKIGFDLIAMEKAREEGL